MELPDCVYTKRKINYHKRSNHYQHDKHRVYMLKKKDPEKLVPGM